MTRKAASARNARADGEASSRLSEMAWVKAAFFHIANNNVDDIRIEELAREIGVTKGSFYWHFRNRQDLLERLLAYWMERATVQIAKWNRATEASGVERLTALLSLPANTPPDKKGADIELAVRAWARQAPFAAEIVEKVDRIRADFFLELIGEMGFEGADARWRAHVAQAFMLGDAFLRSGMSRDERLEAVRICARLITSRR